MSNNIDIKTLEAFQDGNHKAFETVFIAYYNKTKTFIDGYIKSESDAEELTEDLFVNLWINHDSIDASTLRRKQNKSSFLQNRSAENNVLPMQGS